MCGRRRRPRPRVNGVAQFLIRQFLTRDVDRAEPLELLRVCSLAQVDHEAVVLHLLPLVVLKISKEEDTAPPRHREVAHDKLADRQSPLLPINNLERPVAAHRPIHRVERKALEDRVRHRPLLFGRIDELALVSRANVEPSVKSRYTVLSPVAESRHEFADSDFVKFNLHGLSPCFSLLRIMMRE